MRALTLWEPFASCIAYSVKKIETRTYKTNYRGTLLIHAAQRGIDVYGIYLLNFLNTTYDMQIKINRGHIVAQVKLADCVQMTQDFIDQQSDIERGLGGWYVGNYAWILKDIQLISPIPAKGAQGFWVPNPEIVNQIKVCTW